ncbi:MAG: CotH kinase family protein [Methanolinea sp.]|jgi:spore coat protein CotH|nr:CotH kinase family protein [Methanolinea sp.]
MNIIAGTCIPGRQGRRSSTLSCLTLVLAILTVCNWGIAVAVAASGDTTMQVTGVNLSDAAHSNKASPNYAVVFPEDQVNVLTITVSTENWQKMLENMTELYGEFGKGSLGGAPGQQGTEGGNPGNGMWSNTDPIYVPADITFEGVEWPDVGIRFKGFNSLQGAWSEGSYKISLKLNFDKYEDEYPEIKNQRFYGFDELNLQGNYNDDSLIREMVVPSIFRESGVVAPYTAFYRLYVDYGEGPVYFGLYTMVEAVEDTVIETQFADDSGNLYKPEGTGATFAEGTFDRSSFEKKTNEDDADWRDVEALYSILHSDTRLSDPEQWRSELEAVFDVDEFLRWLATNTVIQNWDTYGGNSRNFYLYTDPTNGRITWIPWDNNYALNGGMGGTGGLPGNMNPGDMGGGNRTPGDMNPGDMGWGNRTPGDMNPENMTPGDMNNRPAGGMGSTLSLGLDEVGDNWPLIRYLADDPVYFAQYQGYLEMVATTSFEPSKMEETYRCYHSLIEPYVTGPYGEQSGYTHLKSPDAFDTALDDLIEHVNSRYDAVMEFLSLVPAITPTPTPVLIKDTISPRVTISSPASYSAVKPGQVIQITWLATDDNEVTAVTIACSLNRGLTWTEIADGLPAEGASHWTVPENAASTLTVKVSATDAAGNTGSASRVCRVSSTASFGVSGTDNVIPSPTKPATQLNWMKNASSLSTMEANSGIYCVNQESASFLSPISKPVSQQFVTATSTSSSFEKVSFSRDTR